MAIPDEEIALVRQATDIVAVISEHLALKKVGRRWRGLCPFHQEKTPSFYVNPETGLYHCFGCQASGDAITFLRQTEHLEFLEALERLAARVNITLHDSAAPADRARKERREQLYEVMRRAVSFYRDRLLSDAGAASARAYLAQRGYDDATIATFSLGYSPEDFDALPQALGVSRDILVDAGLGFINRRGRFQDAFRGRVLFPIFDAGDRPVAIGARVVPGTSPGGERDPSKYKNSTETPIYSKRRTLYGLNWAKSDVIAHGEIVVCEGYTDVIGCFRAGIPRAVATCGTALAEEHFATLRKFARRIVLAYDADAAGSAGAERVYEWERSHDVEVAVAHLPSGSDPGQLAEEDPEALRSAVRNAQPFLGFRIGRILGAADLSSAEGRARAFDGAITAVAEHPHELVRDQYVVLLAERTGIDLGRARGQLDSRRTAARRAAAAGARSRGNPENQVAASTASRRVGPDDRSYPAETGNAPDPGDREARASSSLGSASASAPTVTARSGPERPESPSPRMESECIRALISSPEEIAGMLHECLFASPDLRSCFVALRNAEWNVARALDNAVGRTSELLGRLAVEEPSASPGEVWRRLVERASLDALRETEQEIRMFPELFSEREPLRVAIRKAVEDLRDARDPDRATEAGAVLLGWLVERVESVAMSTSPQPAGTAG